VCTSSTGKPSTLAQYVTIMTMIHTGVCDGNRRQISRTRVSLCNGPLAQPFLYEKCSSHEFPTGAVVAVVVVFVVVVAVAGFIIWRNRRLSQRYNALVEERAVTSNSL